MRPFTLLIKPSGSDCNIDCAYCFYKGRDASVGVGQQRMSDLVLETLVRDYMRLAFPIVGFAWQGGEPTLMGVDFFAKAVELQKKYGTSGQQVSNTLQTNGVLLDDNWCRFFHDNKFLLGISIDGPKHFHDRYRVDHSGAGTFERVMRGIQTCKRHQVEFSALVLLNNMNVEHPQELFNFLVENELTFIQYIPCVETDPATGKPVEFSITPKQYADFLCALFDLWYGYGPAKLNIREFDSLLTHYVMGKHTICTYSKQCAGFVVIEHTGGAFCCEFFVEPQWRLGNILETPLEKLAGDRKKRAFARNKERLCDKCLICRHLDICRGGCLKDRTRWGNDAGIRESYFCESYRQFFDYTVPRFMQIAAAIENGSMARHTRSAENIRLRIEK
ncbi:MAG TPA: anaerobic sulfatase maturase [Sedimentisphaerales bacterium]|nr:anaerobic sulfatase maturase [Sedimentisphaerales bacterium]